MPRSWAASSASQICRAIGERLLERKPRGPARDPFRQRVAFNQLENQRARIAAFFQTVDRRDVRVIERGEELRFAMQPREPLGIGGEQLRQHLQRDVATELRIAGAIHLSHAAGAEGGLDLVWTEASAGRERHELKWMRPDYRPAWTLQKAM